MTHTYTEYRLAEQPVIGLFAALGWTKVLAMKGAFSTTGTMHHLMAGKIAVTTQIRAN